MAATAEALSATRPRGIRWVGMTWYRQSTQADLALDWRDVNALSKLRDGAHEGVRRVCNHDTWKRERETLRHGAVGAHVLERSKTLTLRAITRTQHFRAATSGPRLRAQPRHRRLLDAQT